MSAWEHLPLGTRPHGSQPQSSVQPPPTHKHWYHRGYLPHFDAAATHQAITYRLADSLPKETLLCLQREAAQKPAQEREATIRRLIERYLDTGHGSCILGQPESARIVLDTWMETHKTLCTVIRAVVMPNHVHILIRQHDGHPLHQLITRWKSQSARLINHALSKSGPLWMKDYWDRYIRDEQHFHAMCDYIANNPVKAGLATTVEAWPWRI